MFASRRQNGAAPHAQPYGVPPLADGLAPAPMPEEAPQKPGAFDAVAEKLLGVKFSDLALIGKSVAGFLQEARERLDRIEASQARQEAAQARIEAWMVKLYAEKPGEPGA